MCLTYNKNNTKDHKMLLNKKGKMSVYKIFDLQKGRLVTPFQGTIYYKGENVAKGTLYIPAFLRKTTQIYGGALHAFSKKRPKYYLSEGQILVRLVGKKEDYVLSGKNDIAFTKLTIDKCEENRLKKWAAKNNRALYLNPPKKGKKK